LTGHCQMAAVDPAEQIERIAMRLKRDHCWAQVGHTHKRQRIQVAYGDRGAIGRPEGLIVGTINAREGSRRASSHAQRRNHQLPVGDIGERASIG
jgi:hypothetical protein